MLDKPITWSLASLAYFKRLFTISVLDRLLTIDYYYNIIFSNSFFNTFN